MFMSHPAAFQRLRKYLNMASNACRFEHKREVPASARSD